MSDSRSQMYPRVNQYVMVKISPFEQRKCVFVTDSNFLIPLSLQPGGTHILSLNLDFLI